MHAEKAAAGTQTIVIILTTNYGVKQNQFTKLTLEPRASDPKESNEPFDRAIR